MEWLQFALILICGYALGVIVMRAYYIKTKPIPSGVLHINRSDPEQVYMFLELPHGVEDVENREIVHLFVYDDQNTQE